MGTVGGRAATALRGRIYGMVPRCDCWHPAKCQSRGRYDLLAPDGTRCPGGPICRDHARALITEYRDKLQEQWGLRAIHLAINQTEGREVLT